MKEKISAYVLVLLLLLAAIAGLKYNKNDVDEDANRATFAPPDFERTVNLVYLDQGENWGPEERALYYYTPQGTMLHGLRYSWFQNLEGPNGRLAAPENLSKFGFLYSPEQFEKDFNGGHFNPGNLPVGFALRKEKSSGEAVLDISCAVCHTGQLEYKGVSLRVDGGQPMHAFAWTRPGQLLLDMLSALQSTYVNPMKFDRFAEKVLGTRYPDGKPQLKKDMAKSLDGFDHEALTTLKIYRDHGYGRLDALGRIADTVFGDDLDTRNQHPTDAPVSYPHVWDIWKFDWIQWNGSVASAMGRNVGQALGVKARLDLVDEQGNALPEGEIYSSSVLLREQDCIESTLALMEAPRWPEKIFPPIERELAETGKELFEVHCQGCHGPHAFARPEKKALKECEENYPEVKVVDYPRYQCDIQPEEQPSTPCKPLEWKMCVVPVWEIGTDAKVVNNFLDARYDASALDPGKPYLRDLSAGTALDLMMKVVSKKKSDELIAEGTITEKDVWQMKGWGRDVATRDTRGYKARPLHGIWATPPYLHNGSVRTIYELLSPQSEREEKMWIGSREFDPEFLGYENDKTTWAWELDTELEGNHNTGHQFTNDGGIGAIGPELTHGEKMALIEYLKILGNPKYDDDYQSYSAYPGPNRCPQDIQGPANQSGARWPL